MGAKNRAARAGAAAAAVRDSQYLQRIADDEDLRASLLDAWQSTRQAFGRAQSGRQPTRKQIFEDRRLQRDIKSAAASFRDASLALRQDVDPPRRGGFGKLLIVGVIGAGLALVLSEDLRGKVLDAIFGAEEEFEYSAPTPAASPAT